MDFAINQALGGLNVKGGKQSEVLVVSYESTEPAKAAQYANAFAQSYMAFRLDSRQASASSATSWLSERLEELRIKVMESEQALNAYQSKHGMVDSQSRESIISARLGTLSAELIRAQTARGQAEANYGQLLRLSKRPGTPEIGSLAISDPLFLDAHKSHVVQLRKIGELSERYGEKHPKMISARAELGNTQQRMEAEAGKVVERAKKDLEVARIKEAKLSGLISDQQDRMRSLSGKAFELAKLERDVAANRRLYESFLTRFKESDVSQDYRMSNVRLIDPAQTPLSPVRPNREQIVIGALMVGLVLGVGLALVRQFLDRTVKSPDDVEAHVGLPVLGSVMRTRKGWSSRPLEKLSLDEPRGIFAESVNDIRTALMFSRVDSAPRILLVTSPASGDGKTTLASNLALALRNRGKTLLVDADLRRGRVDEVFGASGRPGLSDVIGGQATLSEAVMPDSEAENLYILPAGTRPPNPLEILSSLKFARAIENLAESFDHIIIDGPPVLPISDSLVMGSVVDGAIVVVHAGKTHIDAAKVSVRRLEQSGTRTLGVVLQRVDAAKLRVYADYYPRDRAYYRYAESGTKKS